MTGQELRNSILQMVVQGRLVPQDPGDEPAAVLLERIRAEKERLIKEGKIKRDRHESVIYRRGDSYYEKIDGVERRIDEEIPFEIPERWEWVRLGNIVFNHGQKKPKNRFSYIDIGSIDNIHQCLNSKETILEASCAPSRARKIVYKGDILYSTVRPYLHNMCVVDREFKEQPIASTGFAVLACYSELNSLFLFHYLMSPVFDAYANALENSKGVAYPAINEKTFYNALISLPPLAEQQRIVSKIAELQPFIDEYAAKEQELRNLSDSFPGQLRKSILQMAVQGKLVPQDPGDEPAAVLLERIRAEKEKLIKEGKIKRDKHESVIYRRGNSYYEKIDGVERCIDDEVPFEIPESWEWCRLQNVMLKITDGTHHSPPNGGSGAFMYVTAKNIKNFGVDLTDITFVSETVHKGIYARCNPEPNDVLLIKDGATAGVVTVNNISEPFSLLSSVALLKMPRNLEPWYVVYCMRSEMFYRTVRDQMQGTGIPRITLKQISPFLIPIPPLVEQERIVSKISELQPFIDDYAAKGRQT